MSGSGTGSGSGGTGGAPRLTESQHLQEIAILIGQQDDATYMRRFLAAMDARPRLFLDNGLVWEPLYTHVHDLAPNQDVVDSLFEHFRELDEVRNEEIKAEQATQLANNKRTITRMKSFYMEVRHERNQLREQVQTNNRRIQELELQLAQARSQLRVAVTGDGAAAVAQAVAKGSDDDDEDDDDDKDDAEPETKKPRKSVGRKQNSRKREDDDEDYVDGEAA